MDERVWTDQPLTADESITIGEVNITLRRPGHLTLLSGSVQQGLTSLRPDVKIVGLCGLIGEGDHAIRIARDRVLLETRELPEAGPGWYEEGYAISRADGIYAIFEFEGDGCSDILAQGTLVDLQSESASAAIEFAGLVCLLVRTESSYLLYTDVSNQIYLASFLRGCQSLTSQMKLNLT